MREIIGDAHLYCGRWEDNIEQVEDGSVNLVFVDPPYNIGVFCKMEPGEYLEWCEQWVEACSRKLTANGAFWVSHKDPGVLVEISRIIVRYGRSRINWITWDKYNGTEAQKGFLDGYTVIGCLRSFQVMAEYLIYHADEGQWTAQCDKERGFIFEPIRAYLDNERKRAGTDKIAINVACGFSASAGGMASRHYFSRSQWCLPTQEHYQAMRDLFNSGNGSEYLRREYEDLRKEYKDLRYTFNNPGLVSSVWQISPAPKNGHPTPKPLALLERIVLATSNEGDLILDPMMGRGTTGHAAIKHNRQFIGIELDESHFTYAETRIERAHTVQLDLL